MLFAIWFLPYFGWLWPFLAIPDKEYRPVYYRPTPPGYRRTYRPMYPARSYYRTSARRKTTGTRMKSK
jgi:hypothetical protein